MRKRLLMALFCAAMMLPASAQWNPGDKSLTKIAQESGIEFNSPAIIRKADGSTILVYRTAKKTLSDSSICTCRYWTKTATRNSTETAS